MISISTPAGRSRLISASTVLGLGLLMSIRRLWVRRSNCSRLSLYLWTARRMVTTSFLVGRGWGRRRWRRFSWRFPRSSLRSGRSADGHRPSGGSESFRSVPCCCVPPKKHTKCHCLCHASYGGESDTLNRAYHSISMKKTGILRRLFLSCHGDIRHAADSPAARFTDILRGSYRFAPQSPASSQTAPIQALIYITTDSALCQPFLLPHGEAFPTKGPGPAALFCPSLHFSETVG